MTSPPSALPLLLSLLPGSEQQLPSFCLVLTHQCFEKECIHGWRPSIKAERQYRLIYRYWKKDYGSSNNKRGGDGAEDAKYANISYDKKARAYSSWAWASPIFVSLSSRCRLFVIFLSSRFYLLVISLSFRKFGASSKREKYYDGDIYLGLTPRLRIFLGGGILEVLPFRF